MKGSHRKLIKNEEIPRGLYYSFKIPSFHISSRENSNNLNSLNPLTNLRSSLKKEKKSLNKMNKRKKENIERRKRLKEELKERDGIYEPKRKIYLIVLTHSSTNLSFSTSFHNTLPKNTNKNKGLRILGDISLELEKYIFDKRGGISLPLKEISPNKEISFIEKKYVRSAGSKGKLLRHISFSVKGVFKENLTEVKLPSGEIKTFPSSSLAYLGPVPPSLFLKTSAKHTRILAKRPLSSQNSRNSYSQTFFSLSSKK